MTMTMMMMMHVTEERTEQQKKVFTKWVNAKLPDGRRDVLDLYEEIKDGSLLVELLEQLSSFTLVRISTTTDT